MTDTLATQLLHASQTGQLDSQAARHSSASWNSLHGSLASGQPEAARASLESVLAPLVAHRRAQAALVQSFTALTQARNTNVLTQLPSDRAGLAALSEVLQALIDAAEDTSARIDTYLRLTQP